MKLFTEALVAFAFLTVIHFTAVQAIPHYLFKRTTSFGDCTIGKTTYPSLPGVTVDPDPIASGQSEKYTYSGPIDHDITASDNVGVLFMSNGQMLSAPCLSSVCTGNECPIKAGTNFSKDVTCTAPSNLPDKYDVYVGVGNVAAYDLYACAEASIGS